MCRSAKLGSLPADISWGAGLVNPASSFGSPTASAALRDNAVAARVLLALVVPGSENRIS